jgi:hypothetical protein
VAAHPAVAIVSAALAARAGAVEIVDRLIAAGLLQGVHSGHMAEFEAQRADAVKAAI